MTDTPKPPMVVYGHRHHPSTDLAGNIISEEWMATATDHPYMKGETYIHLDQLMAEVEKRAIYARENGLVGNEYLWALRDVEKELKEQK